MRRLGIDGTRLAAIAAAQLMTAGGCVNGAAAADDSVRRALQQFAPETRAHHACALKGLDVMKRDALLKRADLIKSSIFQGARLTGTLLEAPGAAVRAAGRWYALQYTCTLRDDLMQGLTFTYRLGREVPKQNWERRGLW